MDPLDFIAKSEWPLVVLVTIFAVRRSLARMIDRVSPTKVDAWGFKAEFEKTLDKVELLTSSRPPNARSAALDVSSPIPPADKPAASSSPPNPKIVEKASDSQRAAAEHVQDRNRDGEGDYARSAGPMKKAALFETVPLIPTKALQQPELIVMNAWHLLEATMRKLDDHKHPAIGRGLWNSPRTFDIAARELGLNADEIAALRELRKLRNQVAHSENAPVSLEEALRFQKAVDQLIKRLFMNEPEQE
ncbi:MAG TPA: hypothetical protein VGG27_06695 [Magnetospirillaceae bacterium]|jgi:hypothetical protein